MGSTRTAQVVAWVVEYSPDQRCYHIEALTGCGGSGALHDVNLSVMSDRDRLAQMQRWHTLGVFATSEEANAFADAVEGEFGRP